MFSDAPSSSAPPRTFVAIEYAMRGDLRFLAHHDEIRLLTRALTRADWPIAFSEGFNPQPRLNIPLPRSVGVLSDAQLAVLELREAEPGQALFDRLQNCMPDNAPLIRVIGPLGGRKLHGTEIVYEVALNEQDATSSQTRIAAVLSADELVIERDFGPDKPSKKLNIRPFVQDLEMVPDGLRMRLLLDGQQTARPDEILNVLGCNTAAQTHRICRTMVTWQPAIGDVACWPPRERNSLGKEGHN